MKVIYYVPGDKVDRQIVARVAALVDEGELSEDFSEISSFDKLTQSLRSPGFRDAVVLLFVMNMAVLDELLTIAELLVDLNLVLILRHDDDRGLFVAKAHDLRPRYVAIGDLDLAEIGNVITNIKKRTLKVIL